MQRTPVAPALTEDEQADQAVLRGRNAGGIWIVSSFAACGIGFVARSLATLALCWAVGIALFTIGLAVRSRYWRSARRRLGDATIQRARWRCAEVERESSGRILAAVGLVLMLLSYELWRR